MQRAADAIRMSSALYKIANGWYFRLRFLRDTQGLLADFLPPHDTIIVDPVLLRLTNVGTPQNFLISAMNDGRRR